jgi:hypothetical protein
VKRKEWWTVLLEVNVMRGEEEKVKRILTDPRLSAIKAMLEKDHAIDCLLLLYLGKGKWKDAKDLI